MLPKSRVPSVVVFSSLLYGVLLVSTIVVWALDSGGPRPNGQQIFETMVDGLKVGLGALIGVLSQWAHQSFDSARAARTESADA